MSKIYCCIFLFLSYYISIGQSKNNLDSLKKVLNTLPSVGRSFGADTTRIRLLCQIALRKANTSPDSSIKLSDDALTISLKIKWEKGSALANNQMGYSYLMAGKSMAATDFLFKSLAISEKLKLDSLIGVNYRQLGNAYFGVNKYQKAIHYYQKAMPYLLKVKYYKGYANCLNDIGRGYFTINKYDEALKFLDRCKVFANQYNLPIFQIYCNDSIIEVYLGQKKYISAIDYLNENLSLLQYTPDVIPFDWMMAYKNLAVAYLGLNKPQEALKFALQAKAELPKMQASNGYAVFEILYQIHKELGNSKEALVNYENFISLKEQEKAQDVEKQIRNIEFEYQNEKQKERIELLNKNSEQDRLINILLSVGLIGFLFFVFFLRRINNDLQNKNSQIELQKNQIQDAKEQLEELNATLESKVNRRTSELQKANEELLRKNQEILEALIKGQTIERKRVASELHDNLGSTLTAINWRLEAIDGDNLNEKERKIYMGIIEMMKRAYADVRLISHNMLPAELEEKGVIAALDKFISDVNVTHKLHIELIADESLVIHDHRTNIELFSICLELVNNIIKHAGASTASVSFREIDKQLKVIIRDNGKGMTNQDINGRGLINIQNRVNAISGTILCEATQNFGTQFTITIPIV